MSATTPATTAIAMTPNPMKRAGPPSRFDVEGPPPGPWLVGDSLRTKCSAVTFPGVATTWIDRVTNPAPRR